MPAVALNPGGGTAARIEARVPDRDVARLTALAARRGVRQPVIIRELLRYALDHLEREQAPP